jgi:integrase
VVGTAEGKSSKTFHSFRHSVVAGLQKANVAQEVREALVGHTSQSVHVRVYSDVPLLVRLRDDLEKLAYEVEIPVFVARQEHEDARRRSQRRERGGRS